MARNAKQKRPGDADYITQKDLQIDEAIKALDGKVAPIERKWGVGRLPGLVSFETGMRFSQALQKLDAAVKERNVETVLVYCGVIERAWHAMDQEAINAGEKVMPDCVVSWKGGSGKQYAIVYDADAAKVQSMFKDWIVWTLGEVEVLMEANGMERVEQVKQAFPGAEVTSIKPMGDSGFDWTRGDDIPF